MNSTDDAAKFWPYDPESSIADIKAFAQNFKCIDQDLEIFGSYNSARAQHLAILFKKCDPSKRSCRSE